MNFTQIINEMGTKIGEKASEFSVSILATITEKLGLNATNLSTKLFTIFILALLVWLASKITNKLAKVITILVGIALILSLIFSITL